jgi:hypothetical protein
MLVLVPEVWEIQKSGFAWVLSSRISLVPYDSGIQSGVHEEILGGT